MANLQDSGYLKIINVSVKYYCTLSLQINESWISYLLFVNTKSMYLMTSNDFSTKS